MSSGSWLSPEEKLKQLKAHEKKFERRVKDYKEHLSEYSERNLAKQKMRVGDMVYEQFPELDYLPDEIICEFFCEVSNLPEVKKILKSKLTRISPV